MRWTSVALLPLIAVLLGGCAKPEFEVPSNVPLQLAVYEQGAQIERCVLEPGSTQALQLRALLEHDADSWNRTAATYLPRRVVSGENWSLNFSGNSVVLSLAEGQFSREIDDAQFGFLRCDQHGD